MRLAPLLMCAILLDACSRVGPRAGTHTQPTQTAAFGAGPAPSSPAPTVESAATSTNLLGKRCGNDLGSLTFRNANAGHILLANFYAVSPEDVQFAETATAQID